MDTTEIKDQTTFLNSRITWWELMATIYSGEIKNPNFSKWNPAHNH